MKVIILLFIAGVAGVMGWFFLRGECRGGKVVVSEAQCRQTAGFDAATCAAVFARAESVIRNSHAIYIDRERCLQTYARCIPHPVNGFTPVPEGFCVITSGGTIQSQTPVYRVGHAQRIGG